jgi:dATP pyrophosphohydrolase
MAAARRAVLGLLRPRAGRLAGSARGMSHKRPVSVLVVIHTPDLQALLIERAAHAGYWQSVTGSQEDGETLIETARREVAEETGIAAPPGALRDWHTVNRFEILAEWRHRYAPGVTHNTEHVFSLEVPEKPRVRLAPGEHTAYLWLPWREAAEKCFSWTNRDAILRLPNFVR